jgi:hypothetical protein
MPELQILLFTKFLLFFSLAAYYLTKVSVLNLKFSVSRNILYTVT